jgi:hypothetical protein
MSIFDTWKLELHKMKPTISIAVAGIWIILLIGCSINQLQVTPTEPLGIVNIVLPASPTHTETRTITSMPTPDIPIKTSVTFTPSSTYSLEQKTVHASVAKSMATHQAFMYTSNPATLAARDVSCKDGFTLEFSLEITRMSTTQWTMYTCSPVPKNQDQRWTPGVVDYGSRYTVFKKTDLSKTWIIEHRQFDYSQINRPDGLLFPYRWTADGKYVYFFPKYYPGPDGFAYSAYFYSLIDVLYRLNLETGDFEKVLNDNMDFSLSPNDQFLIYTLSDHPDIVHIMDMSNKKDRQFPLDHQVSFTGIFVWKPDSTGVLFASGYEQTTDNWQDNVSATSIYLLSLKNLSLRTLLQKGSQRFIPRRSNSNDEYWADSNTIHIFSLKPENDFQNEFYLNIQNGKIKNNATPPIEITKTGTPTPKPR